MSLKKGEDIWTGKSRNVRPTRASQIKENRKYGKPNLNEVNTTAQMLQTNRKKKKKEIEILDGKWSQIDK